MRARVVVLGASGFLGSELLRRLLRHPHLELVRVCAADHVGEPVYAALPQLEGWTELRFENPPLEAAIDGADIVMLGLPHAVSAQLVRLVGDRDVALLDLSGAFRLPSAALYERYYGVAHPAPELLGRFVYGLPELHGDALVGARRVATPGCFATCFTLSLLPLARAGLLTAPVSAVGITGSSGSGASPSAGTHHPTRALTLRAYRPLAHQHVPEIEAALREAGAGDEFRLDFVPVSAPLVRGILTSSFATVAPNYNSGVFERAVNELVGSSPFLRRPSRRLPEVGAVAGSTIAEIGYELDRERGVLTAFGALDNLIRGGAGQAVWCLNRMMGWPDRAALDEIGPFP